MKNFKLGLLGLVTAVLPVLLFLQGKKIAANEEKSTIVEQSLTKAKYDSLCIAFDFQVKLAAFYRDNRLVQSTVVNRGAGTPGAINYSGQIDRLSETLRYGIDMFKPERPFKGDTSQERQRPKAPNDTASKATATKVAKLDSLQTRELDIRDRQISQILAEMALLEQQIMFLESESSRRRPVFRAKFDDAKSSIWSILIERYQQLTDRLYKKSTQTPIPVAPDSSRRSHMAKLVNQIK